MMRSILFILLLFTAFQSNAEKSLSHDARAYLVTCGPGNEIYSHFGHSAIRVVDEQEGIDYIYNYGMFESEDPDFVWKFTTRTAQYYLARQDWFMFVQSYASEGRGVYLQEILLKEDELHSLFNALEDNYEDESKRFYLYEFFYDNCATRPRDIIKNSLGDSFQWAESPDANRFTFRELIDQGFTATPWVDFGIDLVLGSRLDQKVDNNNLMFLPRYLSSIAAETKRKNGEPAFGELVEVVPQILEEPEAPWLTPSVVFWVLLVIILLLSVLGPFRWVKHIDGLIFLVFGALGFFLIFMWLGTDHQGAKANYNLIWATPFHLFSIVLLYWKSLSQRLYRWFQIMAGIMLAFILLFWIFPQEFHPAVKPVVVILAFRYFSLYKLSGRNLLFA